MTVANSNGHNKMVIGEWYHWDTNKYQKGSRQGRARRCQTMRMTKQTTAPTTPHDQLKANEHTHAASLRGCFRERARVSWRAVLPFVNFDIHSYVGCYSLWIAFWGGLCPLKNSLYTLLTSATALENVLVFKLKTLRLCVLAILWTSQYQGLFGNDTEPCRINQVILILVQKF